MAAYGSRVYVGGQFTQFTPSGSGTANRVAYWDTADSRWHTMGAGIGDGIVYALAVTADGTVYAGGTFTGRLMKWDGVSWSGVADGPSSGAEVRALTARGNDLYVGGQFTSVGSPPITVRGLAKLSGSAWSSLGTEPWQSATARVRAIAWNGPQMYVTGNLVNDVGGTLNHIFAWVNYQWSDTIPAAPGLYKTDCSSLYYGRALAADRFGGHVYVGGFFNQAGSFNTQNIAVWNDFQPYIITDIGILNGGTYSYGLGVNNTINSASTAVGYAQVSVPGYGLREHACYYIGGPYIIDMGGVWGSADNSRAHAINDSGTIVGYSDYAGSGVQIRAFRWTPSDGFWALNPFPTGDRGNAQAINNNGDIVGFCLNSSGVDRAALWRAGSNDGQNLASLDSLDPTKASYAYGINRDGYIVGKSKNSAGYYRAFRNANPYEAIVAGNDQGTLEGNESIAYAINDSRQIVGTSQNLSGSWRAFIKAPNSLMNQGFTDLGPGYAYAINNYGQVVGVSGSAPFIWDSSVSGIQNLDNLIAPGSGWFNLHPEAINGGGVIVGWGNKLVGQYYEVHGFRMGP